MGKHKLLKRRFLSRNYRKKFIIATEGKVTERQYFDMFNSKESTVKVVVLKSNNKSCPFYVFAKAEEHARKEVIQKNDEVWLVIDRDNWDESLIDDIYKQSKSKNYSLAVSNPKFEYWLLLHFEDGKKATNSNQCSERLKRHLPNYNKHIDEKKIKPNIEQAIQRAEQQDQPKCITWPKKRGTTVYRLVKKLI